jgi:hypothetical protein
VRTPNIFQRVVHRILLRRRNYVLKDLVDSFNEVGANLTDFQAFLREVPGWARKSIHWTKNNTHCIGLSSTYAAHMGASVQTLEAMVSAGYLVDIDTLRAYVEHKGEEAAIDHVGAMIDFLPSSKLRTHYEARYLVAATGSVEATKKPIRL